jgi:protein-disulfide isomerase
MRKPLTFFAILGAAVATVAAPATAAPAKKSTPAPADWTRAVVETPEGGFRMGNPAAKVRLVEYASLTCPHCASFAASAKGPLAKHVRSGRVSFEYRPYVLNGFDLMATLLTRCAGPSRFFAFSDTLFETQSQWLGRIDAVSEADRQRIGALPEDEQLAAIAEAAGLTQVAVQHGVPAEKAKACLADAAAVQRLEEIGAAADASGVSGTPTFSVNGSLVHAHEWAELEPLIAQAGG